MAAALSFRQHRARRTASWRATALLYLGLVIGVLAMHSFITAQPLTAVSHQEAVAAPRIGVPAEHQHHAGQASESAMAAMGAMGHAASADHGEPSGHGGHSGAEHLMHLCVAILVALVGLALALLAMHLARTRRTRRAETSLSTAPVSAAWRRLHRLKPVLPGPALLLRLGVSLT